MPAICPYCGSSHIHIDGIFYGNVCFDEDFNPIFDIYCVDVRLVECKNCKRMLDRDEVAGLLSDYLNTAFTLYSSKTPPSQSDLKKVSEKYESQYKRHLSKVRNQLFKLFNK